MDVALVDFSGTLPQLLASHDHPIPEAMRLAALNATQPRPNEVHELFVLDHQYGHLFAEATLALLKKSPVAAHQVRAIGSHGQTIRHQPNHQYPYTIQIGDPNIIAALTGITTIADFRRRDIANGGQGAPFAPIFHAHVLSDEQENRAVVNIGGIANVTLLAKGSHQAQLGFDTGPGNGLIDSWIQRHLNQPYDKNGEWAAQGTVITELLAALLEHPYFQQAAPKSTGRDHFNLQWLEQTIQDSGFQRSEELENIQATLTELTAISIANAIQQLPMPINRIILCGGGAHNTYLVKRIQALAAPIPVNISDEFGVSADWLEAELFAWLAQQTLHKHPLDLTKVTGASKPAILGGIYWS
ncbi:MAG: anhydro-N-acetylmuramic acid kinase [Gammaproteobacteria bacterium]